MPMFDNPNFVRDVFWTGTLNRMFEATEGPDEADAVEFVEMNYMIIRMMPDIAIVIKLPEGAEDYTDEQIDQFMAGLKLNAELMMQELHPTD